MNETHEITAQLNVAESALSRPDREAAYRCERDALLEDIREGFDAWWEERLYDHDMSFTLGNRQQAPHDGTLPRARGSRV